MSAINYAPIATRSTCETFLDYVDSLDIPQIDYFAIGVQHHVVQKSISLMSLAEWQQHFTSHQYAAHDPIRKATLYTKRNFIPFSEIDYVDNFGKEIMRQRARMGIKNGIILMDRFEKFNYMITLGTGFSDFEPFDFIKKYHDKVHVIKNDFINLVKKDVSLFLPKAVFNASKHLSSDAK